MPVGFKGILSWPVRLSTNEYGYPGEILEQIMARRQTGVPGIPWDNVGFFANLNVQLLLDKRVSLGIGCCR